MDEQPEQEWPTHCKYCDTELESGLVNVVPHSDSEHLQTGSPATVVFEDFCPNENCPGKESDMAGPASGEAERIEGVLGGDSGLADGR